MADVVSFKRDTWDRAAALVNDLARTNWDAVRRFTPADYEDYEKAPLWEVDSIKFNSELEYNNYYVSMVKDLVQSSKAVIGKWQEGGKEAARAVEQNHSAATPIFDFQGALATEPLPIAISQIHEKVALLSANPAMPQVVHQQESQVQYVAALNQLMQMVLDGNNYDSCVSRAFYDIQFWNAACFRWRVDMFEPGIFGDKGKVDLDVCSLDTIYFDPKCKELDCKYMDYVIQRHDMEMGEIQSLYPLAANMVHEDFEDVIADSSVSSKNIQDYIQSPQPKLARDTAQRRQKIAVFECWIRDSRTKFEPEVVEGTDKKYVNRFKTDEDGYIIGTKRKRYPNGRLIVIAGNVVLKDIPNPFAHGQFPFVFVNGMPSSVPYAKGNGMNVMAVSRKINNVIKDIHRYYQSEIPRPMQCTPGAINDPNMAQQVPNDVSYIIELNGPSAKLERRPAMDVPNNVFTFLQLLMGELDRTSGSSGVMRGQLEEGDQLSADAMGQLAQFASSRLALETKRFNSGVKQLGYQLMWILRAIIRSDMKLTVSLPNGTNETINWKSDRETFEKGDPIEIQNLRAKEDYLVSIKAGTGSPGAQQQQQAGAQALFNDNAIDRQAFLDQIQYPGRQAIVARMRDQELENIKSKAVGKEIGLAISEQIKQEHAGRREKV